MPPIHACMILTAAAALSACVANGDRLSSARFDHYAGSYVADAASKGPVPLRVYGEPTPGAGELATAEAVAASMAGANIGTPLAYAATVDRPPRGYVLVVSFGPDRAPAANLCRGDDPRSGVGPDYAMAFCIGDISLSHLFGVVGDRDIASPGFRQAMATAAIELLPPENPEYRNCDGAVCG